MMVNKITILSVLYGMRKPGIVSGQRINEDKLKLSRRIRKAMTYAEKIFWTTVRGGKVHGLRVRRQQIIDGFIVDFYCPALRTVIELDGGVHNDAQEHDRARDDILKKRGLRILRFSNEEVLEAIDRILRLIEQTSPQLRAGQGFF